MLLALIETNVVEDEELGFGTEVGSIGNACRPEVELGLFRNIARIAVVALLRNRVNHIADHHQGWDFGEGVHHVCRGIGNEEHVAFIDRRPTANGRTIHAESFFERIFGQLANRVRNVLP